MSNTYDQTAIRKQRTDLWVGLFVFLGLAIMGALVVQFGRFSDRMRETYFLYVTYPDAGNILRGAPVRLGGAKVGVVAEDPQLNADFIGVKVTLEIHQDKKIPAGSHFAIASSGLMGDLYIRIKSPEEVTGKYFEPNAEIKGDSTAGLDEIQAEAGVLSDRAKLMMEDIREAVKSLDKTLKKIDEGMLSDENLANIEATLADLKETGKNFKSASAKLEPLFDKGKEAVEEAKTAFVKAGETMDTAKGVIKKAEPAMEKLEPTISELKETLAKANKAIDKITKGDGTAAALISDKQLKNDLESFISNLNEHGILRYKNEEKKKVSSAKEKTDSDSSRGGLKKWFGRKR
ncbi:MAG: MlaD family protein [Verrucomicrobiales bacterium]|nr:MlaD family protein [Verrucomicrobiales bacterium]